MKTKTANDDFFPQPEILRRYSISEMTLSRWRRDKDLGFPPPTTIRKRNFYRRAEIVAWETAQAAKSAKSRGPESRAQKRAASG